MKNYRTFLSTVFLSAVVFANSAFAESPNAAAAQKTKDQQINDMVSQGILPPLPGLPEDKEGYLPWKRLMKLDKTLWDLAGKVVKVEGFMFPLDQAEKQGHFLLSVFPPSCPFCLPAGPNGMIEIFAKKPIEFNYELIGIEGTIEFPEKDPMGLRYRIRDAQIVKQ